MPPIHRNGDARRAPDALPAARRLHSTRAFEMFSGGRNANGLRRTMARAKLSKRNRMDFNSISPTNTSPQPDSPSPPAGPAGFEHQLREFEDVLRHLLRGLPCSRAKPTRHIWTPGIPIRNIWSRGIPIHHCWIGTMIYMRRLRPPPGHWWPPEKALRSPARSSRFLKPSRNSQSLILI